jgi:hypothetical protein
MVQRGQAFHAGLTAGAGGGGQAEHPLAFAIDRVATYTHCIKFSMLLWKPSTTHQRCVNGPISIASTDGAD